MQSEKIGELSKALAKAQGQMKKALKDSTNPFFKSNYADLGSVWEACSAALQDNGLAVAQGVDFDGATTFLWTRLIHSSGEWMQGRQPLLLVKQDPQAQGSAMTYARRYSLAAMVGVMQTDDDAESAMPAKVQASNGKAEIAKIKACEEISELETLWKSISAYKGHFTDRVFSEITTEKDVKKAALKGVSK